MERKTVQEKERKTKRAREKERERGQDWGTPRPSLHVAKVENWCNAARCRAPPFFFLIKNPLNKDIIAIFMLSPWDSSLELLTSEQSFIHAVKAFFIHNHSSKRRGQTLWNTLVTSSDGIPLLPAHSSPPPPPSVARKIKKKQTEGRLLGCLVWTCCPPFWTLLILKHEESATRSLNQVKGLNWRCSHTTTGCPLPLRFGTEGAKQNPWRPWPPSHPYIPSSIQPPLPSLSSPRSGSLLTPSWSSGRSYRNVTIHLEEEGWNNLALIPVGEHPSGTMWVCIDVCVCACAIVWTNVFVLECLCLS